MQRPLQSFIQAAPVEGVVELTPVEATFEERYLQVRAAEGRLGEDHWVSELPWVSARHPLSSEWRTREWTMSRFLRSRDGRRVQRTLDLGCGNGWFSHQLMRISQEVVGLDVNREELRQAARVFGRPGLVFCLGDVFEVDWTEPCFDLITLNASVQYFPNLAQLLDRLLQLLRPEGEIHLLDSPLYAQGETAQARTRTQQYFSGMGMASMSAHYFHHTKASLDGVQYTCMYRPDGLLPWVKRRVFPHRSPFPWIRITNPATGAPGSR